MIFFILVLSGFFLLLSSGYFLVKLIIDFSYSSRISLIFLSSVIVAIGTSLPELVLTTVSLFRKEESIALGNVFGSNVFNTLVILGFCLLIHPILIKKEDVLIIKNYFFITISFWIWILFFSLTKVFGVVSLVFFLVFLYKNYLISLRNSFFFKKKLSLNKKILFLEICRIISCLIFLLIGANYVVIGIQELVSLCGFSSLFVSSLILGIGTSLPELITCLMASINKQNKIILGTVIGSNIFNMLGVLGIGALVSKCPLNIPSDVFFYYLPMFIFSLLGFTTFGNASKYFSKLGGLLLLIVYVVFFVFLSLREKNFFS